MNALFDTDLRLHHHGPLPTLFSEPDTYACDIPMELPDDFSCHLNFESSASLGPRMPRYTPADLNVKLAPEITAIPTTPVFEKRQQDVMTGFSEYSFAPQPDVFTSQPAGTFSDAWSRKRPYGTLDYQYLDRDQIEHIVSSNEGEFVDTESASESFSEVSEDEKWQESVVQLDIQPTPACLPASQACLPASEAPPAACHASEASQGARCQPEKENELSWQVGGQKPLKRLRLEFANGVAAEVTYPIDNRTLSKETGLQILDPKGPPSATPAMLKYIANLDRKMKQMKVNKAREELQRRRREEERHRRALRRAVLKGEELPEPNQTPGEALDLAEELVEEAPETPIDTCQDLLDKQGEAMRLKEIAKIDTLDYGRVSAGEDAWSRVTIVGVDGDKVGGLVVEIPHTFVQQSLEYLATLHFPAVLPAAKPAKTKRAPVSPCRSQTILSQLVGDAKLWKQCMQEIRGGVRCRAKKCPKTFSCLAELAFHYDTSAGECHGQGTFLCKDSACPWAVVGFSVHSELTRHERATHNGDSFDCPSCGREYTRKDSLKRHLVKCANGTTMDVFAATKSSNWSPETFLAAVASPGGGSAMFTSRICRTDSLKLRQNRINQLVFAMADLSHDFLMKPS